MKKRNRIEAKCSVGACAVFPNRTGLVDPVGLVTNVVLLAIKGYRATKPWRMDRCRFYPSCSAYSLTAVQNHGLLVGGILTLWRLIRCQPLHPGGVDEVPAEKQASCLRSQVVQGLHVLMNNMCRGRGNPANCRAQMRRSRGNYNLKDA